MTKRIVHHQFPFTNDYVFSKVMRNPEYCKEILTRILPDKKVKELKVLNDILEEESSGAGSFEAESPGTESGQQADSHTASTQVSVSHGIFSKGVRFDVLFEDDENIYNIEMQCAKEDDLPLRARYYSSQLDMELLPKGKKYTHLKTSYVIFICTFDPTGTDEAVSTFEFYNIKKQLPLKDRRYIIFVNTKSEERNISRELHNLFEYINHNSVDEKDIFLRKLEKDIEELNHENEEWRRDIMKLEEKFAWAREDAMEEGLAKGKELGISQGLEKGRCEGRKEGESQANTKTAKKMKSKGYEPEEISELTGLTAEEIEQL